MPCYDGRDQVETRTVYESGISPDALNRAKQESEKLEAVLCAVFSELERRGIAAEVIAEASRNGLIGVMKFWRQHSQNDEARIANELHKYSKDEQAVMRKLLA